MNKAKFVSWQLLPLLAVALTTQLWAQQASPPVVSSRLQKATGTVAAIDAATRTVTLKGANGLENVQVDKSARNFDNLHVGDKVTLSYYQGLAAQIKKGDSTVEAPAGGVFGTRAPEGAKPGGVVGASITATVSIQAVDTASHTVSFKRSDGSMDVIQVKDPKMRKFVATLKQGDVVEVTYTESVAIDVTPAS
jgi:Cu/Ag efflux protein CusF